MRLEGSIYDLGEKPVPAHLRIIASELTNRERLGENPATRELGRFVEQIADELDPQGRRPRERRRIHDVGIGGSWGGPI